MEGSIDLLIASLVHLIETKYISTSDDYRPMDFGEKASFFTLDVISELAFGEAFGYLENDSDVFDYLSITKTFIPIMMVMGDVPSFANLLQSPALRGLLPSESDKLGFGAFIGYVSYIFNDETHVDLITQYCKETRSTAVWTGRQVPSRYARLIYPPWSNAGRSFWGGSTPGRRW
jgi:hypothetical protein